MDIKTALIAVTNGGGATAKELLAMTTQVNASDNEALMALISDLTEMLGNNLVFKIVVGGSYAPKWFLVQTEEQLLKDTICSALLKMLKQSKVPIDQVELAELAPKNVEYYLYKLAVYGKIKKCTSSTWCIC